jgi:ABC-type branched-subunit amino acid transport system substrate-binding protein
MRSSRDSAGPARRGRHPKLSIVAVTAAIASLCAACSSSSHTSSSTNSTQGTTSGSASPAGSSGSGGLPNGPIKLGAIFSLSGTFAAYGAAQKATEATGIAELNKSGGIDGHQVELLTANDQSTPNGALAAARQLIGEGVVGFEFIGISPDDAAAAPVLDQAKIPMIGLLTDNTYENGTQWPYIFNDYADAKTGATPYGAFIKQLGYTKVGIIHDTTPASVAFASGVANSVQNSGITVTKSVSFAPTAVDLTTEVQEIKGSGAQMLLGANVVDYPALYTALKAVGWSPPMILATAAYYDDINSLGSMASKTYAVCNIGTKPGFTYPTAISDQLSTLKSQLGGVADEVLSVISAYDSLLMYKAAIESTHSTSGPEIIKYLNGISNQSFSFPGMNYTFTAQNHEGVLAADNYICKIEPLDQYGTPPIYQP